MDANELKRRIRQLALERGVREVCVALMSEGLAPRTAERLALGDHKGSFRRRTVAAVNAVLERRVRPKAS